MKTNLDFYGGEQYSRSKRFLLFKNNNILLIPASPKNYYGNCQMGTTGVFKKIYIPSPPIEELIVPSDITPVLVDGGLKIRGISSFKYPILSSSPQKLIREKYLFLLSYFSPLPPSAIKSFNKSFTKNVTFAMGDCGFGC